MMPDSADLIRHAKMVLDFNWAGDYTKPGPRLYPHQWSWDSALITIGYGYLSLLWGRDSSDYILQNTAQRPAVALARLLRTAGIVEGRRL